MEWFESIKTWFSENFNGVVVFVQSLNLAGVITAVTAAIKSLLATRTNTNNVKLLNGTLKDNEKVKTVVNTLIDKVGTASDKINSFSKQLKEYADIADKTMIKINAILDVQSLVYQTIKNEDTRVAVENILANARYNETATREALSKQIEDLQSRVKQLTDDAMGAVNEIVEQSAQLLSVDQSVKEDSSIPRG